jgi:hypothetical protein
MAELKPTGGPERNAPVGLTPAKQVLLYRILRAAGDWLLAEQ